MLHYIVSLALLAYAAMGNMNNVTSKYIIYQFGVLPSITYFPYAIISDYCQAGSIGSISYKFACSTDGDAVTVNKYTTTDCSGTAITSVIYKNATTSASVPNAFSCTGNDEYAQISFGVGSGTCQDGGTNSEIRVALNRCARVPINATAVRYLSVYCGYEYAELQYYASSDSSCTGSVASYYATNDTCGYMFPFGTFEIYGNIEECTEGSAPTSPAMMINGIIALIIALIRRAGDRALQLLLFNEESLVSASHQLALITSLPFSEKLEGRSAERFLENSN